MVASKLDSNSLIRDRSMGNSQRISNIVITGLIFALRNGGMSSLPKNIVFALFGAENFAFSGSQRFVDDISSFSCQKTDLHDNCPLNRGSGCSSPCHRDLNFTKLGFERIESIIEYDTVGHLYDPGEYFIHADDPSLSSTLLSDFAKNFQAPEFNSSAAKEMKVSAAGEGSRLPPSSAMAFLKKKRSIPTIVVSDYKSEYTNRYLVLI